MISSKGKTTDLDFVMFKKGVKEKILIPHKKAKFSDDDEDDSPKQFTRVYTPELLNKIKEEILSNQKKEEKSKTFK